MNLLCILCTSRAVAQTRTEANRDKQPHDEHGRKLDLFLFTYFHSLPCFVLFLFATFCSRPACRILSCTWAKRGVSRASGLCHLYQYLVRPALLTYVKPPSSQSVSDWLHLVASVSFCLSVHESFCHLPQKVKRSSLFPNIHCF